jgi:hypothetical protein
MLKQTILGVLFVIACGDVRSGPSEQAAALGIESYSIHELDSTLTVVGVGSEGAIIARIELVNGELVFDPDVDDRGRAIGRQLHVDVRGELMLHQSEGFDNLLLPTDAMSDSVRAVLLDPIVRSALAGRGVAFDPTKTTALPPDEVPFLPAGYVSCSTGIKHSADSGSGGSNPCTFAATSNCGQNSCRQANAGTEKLEYRCCNGAQKAVQRRCKSAGAATACGTAGPGGCAVCWAQPHLGVCSAGGQYPSQTAIHMEWCGDLL